MALTPGNTIPGSTTLSSLVDLIYANKTGALSGAGATFTALEPHRFMASWPGVNNGDNVVYFVVTTRPVVPATIKHS